MPVKLLNKLLVLALREPHEKQLVSFCLKVYSRCCVELLTPVYSSSGYENMLSSFALLPHAENIGVDTRTFPTWDNAASEVKMKVIGRVDQNVVTAFEVHANMLCNLR